MAKGEKGTAVKAPEEPKGTAVAEVPPMMSMFENDAGQGLENVKKEDTKIPFLRILQPLSPQVQDGDPQYIEGAKAGMLFNSVTHEVFDGKEGVNLIPVHFEKVYLEWKPRTVGGGFVAAYDTREDADRQATEGNDIADTANHYCLIRSKDDLWLPIVLSCKSTMLGVSRAWNAMMQNVQIRGRDGNPFVPPTFACIYNISTARQQNDKGTWYNINVERIAMVDDARTYAMAKEFRRTLTDGKVSLNYAEAEEGTGEVQHPAGAPTF